MYYIVYDLEFNQDIPAIQEDTPISGSTLPPEDAAPLIEHIPVSLEDSLLSRGALPQGESKSIKPEKRMPFEILQIGALKLDHEFHTVNTFARLVKPTLYPVVSPFITELTGITTDQLKEEVYFPEVYQDFIRFIGEEPSVFCVWGKSDVKELYRNAFYHDLDQILLPKQYLNIQPYASEHLGFSAKKLLRLKHTVEALGIELSHSFHDALGDAYYTAEILKKIYRSSMKLKTYDPQQTVSQTRKPKQIINFDQLLRQFEKMYERDLTEEEKGMIKLAYHMGRTRQFIHEI